MNPVWDSQGWHMRARHAPSPYCDARPPGMAVDLIVVHAISLPPERFGSGDVVRFFQGQLDFSCHPYYAQLRDLRVSAHFFIERDGVLWQHVGIGGRAWHAGQSCWKGRPSCNDFSVGIELEGSETQPFTDAEYGTLTRLVGDLRSHFPHIGPDAVAGHAEIAPGRKWDPGPFFEWSRLREPAGAGGC